jgi:NAD-dependent SIR2 family protein deacetylase
MENGVANLDDIVAQAAAILADARRVLFLTSAGMSADSGIPTFRDKEGYWNNFPPFKAKGLEPQDLASPWAFRNVLPHAWAFYEWRRRNAHENAPHAGYRIIDKWMAGRDAFIHTTNTDGYHLRSGCPPDRVKEVHGSMWRLQCLDACSPAFWDEPSVPLCRLDYDAMQASDFPRCPRCRAIARPHILMFGDGEYVGHPEQEENFSRYMREKIDVALLVGSSGTVPTNDYLAYSLQQRGTRIIAINPDPDANRIAHTPYFLRLKSREAFARLDDAMDKLGSS